MKRLTLIAPLVAAGLLPAGTYAQVTQDRDIARVISVSAGGVCEACPDGHQEKRRKLSDGSHIKTNEMTHCLGSAKAEAVYLTRDGKDVEGGDFELEGDDWQPLALPGAPEKMKPEQKRLGTQAASPPPPDKGIAMSTDPLLAAEVEQKAQNLQQRWQATSAAPVYHYAETSQADHKRSKATLHANRKLSRDVSVALSKAKGVSVQNIEVRAKNGKVVLHGTVPEHSQVGRATDVAKGVSGVTSVKNKLSIRPDEGG
jgi:hyperosmotically inducible protein